MTDNLFDRLAEMLQSPGPVNWKLAREVADSLAGVAEPVDPATVTEFEQLARLAELHVAEASGLDLTAAAADVHVVDRQRWAEENLRSFSYLMDPLAEKLVDPAAAGPLDAILKPLGPAILGMQMGSMVGFMSQRVLGQFDVGLPAMGRPGLFFVVPNLNAFATDHQIDRAQARLWVALHEVTHQAEFSIPWVSPYFLALIADYFDGLTFDPSSITDRIESLESPEQLESLLAETGGVAGLVTGPHQHEVLAQIQAFMAIVEGYADYLMDTAAPRLIPDTPRIREAINRRRAEPTQGEELLQQMLGLELKRHQYRLGSTFCSEVARRLGEHELVRLWDSADNLPTLEELEDPVGWAARVLL